MLSTWALSGSEIFCVTNFSNVLTQNKKSSRLINIVNLDYLPKLGRYDWRKLKENFRFCIFCQKFLSSDGLCFSPSEHFWYQEKITKYLITIIVAQTSNIIPVKLLERIKQGKCPRVNLTFYGVWEFWTKLSPKPVWNGFQTISAPPVCDSWPVCNSWPVCDSWPDSFPVPVGDGRNYPINWYSLRLT